jgi:predicted alpha/beta superfamily hydrolase
MLTNELLPAVNSALRTLTGPENTGMMGSSLGGLISVYASVHAASTFGIIGAMSPSTWWDNKWIIGDVTNNMSATTRPGRVYIDHGTPGDDAINTATLAQTFKNKGFVEGTTLHYVVEQGASHAEAFWAGRLPGALKYMFPN